jgi:alpha-glucosidase (family GH31 glycosyl hydrolase)
MQFFNKIDYSYMLGPDIFVAPFLTEGTEITVNFPSDGNWTYVYDYNLSYQGGTTSALTIPYTEYPVFFRSGTSPLDVEEMENGLSIFPNPSNGIFNLTLNQTENISIEVLNITGQTIYSVSGDFKTHLIDLSGQQNGVYICVVTGPNGERSFVKLVRS